MDSLYPPVQIGNLTFGEHEYRDCIAKFGHYGNGNLAIVIDLPSGERLAVATVNMEVPGLFIKDYAENEGLLKQLVDKGLVEEVGVTFTSGYVEVPEVKLKGKFADAISPWNGTNPATREDVSQTANKNLEEYLEKLRAIFGDHPYTNPPADPTPEEIEARRNATEVLFSQLYGSGALLKAGEEDE